MFIDLVKANFEIGKLNKELADTKADRDAQIAKLAEFEKTHKDYIESAQTAEAMKEGHKKELETLKAEYEQKLADKDKELVAAKDTAAKEISTIKGSVAEETIRLVASQGTNVEIENAVEELTPAKVLATFNSLSGEAKQKFYNEHRGLILKANSPN
jgi:hypothetical protein